MCSANPTLESSLLRALDARSQAGVWFAIKTDTTVYGVMELRQGRLAVLSPEELLRAERMGYRLGYALETLLHECADFRVSKPPIREIDLAALTSSLATARAFMEGLKTVATPAVVSRDAPPPLVLFRCQSNARVSILAEAILRHLAPQRVRAESAAEYPASRIDPRALECLQAHGIKTTGLRSKGLRRARSNRAVRSRGC